MTSRPGMGVMLSWLSGNESSVAAVKASIGKTLASVECVDNELRLRFTDGTGIILTWHDKGECLLVPRSAVTT